MKHTLTDLVYPTSTLFTISLLVHAIVINFDLSTSPNLVMFRDGHKKSSMEQTRLHAFNATLNIMVFI